MSHNEDNSPYMAMLKDVKNEILKQLQNSEASFKQQLQNSEASIKQQFRSSLEETNSKLSNLTHTVKEKTNSVKE